MEDDKIIELFFARDEGAIKETSSKYGRQLKRLSMNIVDNYAIAQECENDTYLAAWNSIPPQSPTYLFSYLAKIIRHISLDFCKRKNAQKRSAIFVELTREMEECIPAPNDESLKLQDEEFGQIISRFLFSLDLDVRRVFVHRYWYMSSINVIAKIFGMSESKVKSMLFRTRKKLRDHLEKEGYGL